MSRSFLCHTCQARMQQSRWRCSLACLPTPCVACSLLATESLPLNMCENSLRGAALKTVITCRTACKSCLSCCLRVAKHADRVTVDQRE